MKSNQLIFLTLKRNNLNLFPIYPFSHGKKAWYKSHVND